MDEKRSKATKAGIVRAATRGRKGGAPRKVSDAKIRAAMPLGATAGAKKVGLSRTQFITRRRAIEEMDG